MRDTDFISLDISDIREFDIRVVEHTEYIHKELRGKSYEEIASQCPTRDSVLNLRLDIRAKLVIYNIVDKTAYLKYIRNVEQCKYKRGAHNSQNRQRF